MLGVRLGSTPDEQEKTGEKADSISGRTTHDDTSASQSNVSLADQQ